MTWETASQLANCSKLLAEYKKKHKGVKRKVKNKKKRIVKRRKKTQTTTREKELS